MKDYLKEYFFAYHWDPSKAVLRAIEAKIMSSLDFAEPVLDIGCGDGIFSAVLLKGKKVIGLDISLRSLKRTKNRKFYSGLVVADAKHLPFKNSCFASILINSSLEHIPEYCLPRVLIEANRVLGKGRKIVVTVNSSSFGNEDPLKKILSKAKLDSLALLWHRYRNKRLALFSLKDFDYWQDLFKKTNFKILSSRYYLPPYAENRFFLWTELQYLGISRLNLGSLVRALSRVLSFLGIEIHRRLIAAVFSNISRKDYLEGGDSGSCILFLIEKAGDAGLFGEGLNRITGIDKEEILRPIEKESPCVSVIIPSFDGYRGGSLARLVESLKEQSFKDIEVIVVKGVSPQGRAINLGVRMSKSDILLIMDDDSRMDNPDVIKNMVSALSKDKTIGMAGASILVPPDANWLQKRAGREFPRFGMRVVDTITESDMACHGCCAIPKKVFEEVGGERESILRGLDPDLRFRMRKLGYKTVLVANTWVYHPLPGTLGSLIKAFFRNGMGSAYCFKYQPELIYDTDETLELKSFKAKIPFIFRLFRFPLRLLKALIEFKFLRVLGYCIYAIGFFFGILKYALFKKDKMI